jgi:predicted SnoaL-like aldol condensation-catalyzing enzyme
MGVTSPDLAANKALVTELYTHVIAGGDIARADRLLAPGYIQHNPNVPTGRDGFKRYFTGVHRRFAIDLTIHNIVAEADMVVIHVTQKIRSKRLAITVDAMDRFRIADGAIAEHWDVMHGAGRLDRLLLELNA